MGRLGDVDNSSLVGLNGRKVCLGSLKKLNGMKVEISLKPSKANKVKRIENVMLKYYLIDRTSSRVLRAYKA